MKVLKEFKNNLLKRREVKVEIDSISNPGAAAVSKKIAEHYKVDEKHVAVKKIGSEFGESRFVVDAFVYDSHEGRIKIEPKIKVKKKAEGA